MIENIQSLLFGFQTVISLDNMLATVVGGFEE